MTRAVCIIPARGGSTRIPRKNIRPFYGRPIITYSIELAQSLGMRVVVSTEDAEIAQVAREYDCEVRQRPFELAADDVGTHAVWKDALQAIGYKRGRTACLYPCAPLLDAELFGLGLAMRNVFALTVGADPLRDAGAGYWGEAREILRGAPLIQNDTRLIVLHPDDVVDINTEDDWRLAVSRYAVKHHISDDQHFAEPV